MSLSLNNSKDITCDALYWLDSSNTLQNVPDLIANAGGGGGSGITTLTATLPLSVTNVSALNKNLTIDLTSYSHTSIRMIDSGGTVRNLTSSLTGALVWNTSQLVTLTYLSSYTDTTGINTLLPAYTDTTALNTLLSAYTNTAGLNTLLSAFTNTTTLIIIYLY